MVKYNHCHYRAYYPVREDVLTGKAHVLYCYFTMFLQYCQDITAESYQGYLEFYKTAFKQCSPARKFRRVRLFTIVIVTEHPIPVLNVIPPSSNPDCTSNVIF